MAIDRSRALEALLVETETAHGAYETAELGGVYDQDWPRWYADYAVAHGAGELVGRPVSPETLARLLVAIWDGFQHADPKPPEPWTAYAARRLLAEL